MTDARLRELERRWQSSLSVDDEATLLRERVRVGDLTQGRLELAAYCGHAGALATTTQHTYGGSSDEFVELVADRFGSDAAIAAGICAVFAAWTLLRESGSGLRERSAGDVGVLLDWLGCPCVTHKIAVREIAARPRPPVAPGRGSSWLRLAAWSAAVAVCRSGGQAPVRDSAADALLNAECAWAGPRHGEVLSETRKCLGRWALGYSDPGAKRLRSPRSRSAAP